MKVIMGYPRAVVSAMHSRATLTSSVATQWTFNAGVSLMFPVMQAKIGTENVLWMFAGMCALATAFSSTFVEETKGRKLEDIGGAKNE